MVRGEDICRVKERIAKHLSLPYSFANIHGSSEYCFENIAFTIGIMQGDLQDRDMMDFYELYLQRYLSSDSIMISDFVCAIVVNCLLYMGKALGRKDDVVTEAFQERLNRIHFFSLSGESIFYSHEERTKIKSIPAVWKNYGIVKCEHTNPYLQLPIVYDLLGLSVMYGIDENSDRKIDDIVRYIFSNTYQEEVKNGYGIGINRENGFVKSKFYSVGWDVGLSPLTPKQALLYMKFFSPIPTARDTTWYQTNLVKYKTAIAACDDNFLSELYRPIRKTYWSSGCYMNFGSNQIERKMGVIDMICKL